MIIYNKSKHCDTHINIKSARKVQGGNSARSKSDSRYWLKGNRLFKWRSSPNYSCLIQHQRRRHSFSLGTPNKDAASKIAAGICADLIIHGWDDTIAKHKGIVEKKANIATVGEWITAAGKVSGTNSATFISYSRALRKIAGDILSVQRTTKRFGPRKGGAADYRAEIDSVSLNILSLPAIQQWRLEYVKKAKTPAEEGARMTSCNSTIRQARSLFATKIVKFLPEIILPSPPPFHDVEFYPRQSAKYFSRINPKDLLLKARADLSENDPATFIAMLLAIGAGLRRGEIDSLQWHQVDFNRQLIRVETTDTASLKTVDARDEVAIDEHIVAILRGFHAKRASDFVVEGSGNGGGPKKWGHDYRAGYVFDKVIAWLRENGVTARKPLHELRKELGAIVTAEHGIYAASRVMRHSSVATTAAHYSDLKNRPVVNIGGWLTEDEKVTAISTAATVTKPVRSRKKRAA
jgi:integrase